MIIVGKPIEGISINGLEWLLNDDDELVRFIDINSAKSFLSENGLDDEEINSCWFEDYETGTRV